MLCNLKNYFPREKLKFEWKNGQNKVKKGVRMLNKFTYGLVLFSVLMALSFGIAFAETGASDAPQKDTTDSTTNESLNNATANETLNETINDTTTEAVAAKEKSSK